MSDGSGSEAGTESEPERAPQKGLSFDRAEPPESGGGAGERAEEGLTCSYCRRPIGSEYYEVNGLTACEPCRHNEQYVREHGSTIGKLFRATLGGGIGGAVGAGIYYGVLAITGYEIGLVAIVVGLLVGVGVRWGSGWSGGRGYQVLAVAITYVAIVSTYIPFILEGLSGAGAEAVATGDAAEIGETEEAGSSEESTGAGSARAHASTTTGERGGGTPAQLDVPSMGALGLALVALLVLAIALAAPFLAGIENVIGLLIIGFALYEAWRVNAYQRLLVEGPFRVGEPRPERDPDPGPGSEPAP